MKPRPSLFSSRPRSDSGIALILVLGMLALIVILMVAFLGSVSTELRSAKTYASGLDAKSLADSSVNIVISQIQDATATPQYAWASQPGMIRTYDNTGNAVAAYKLYSSDSLRVTGAFNPLTNLNNEIPSNWTDFGTLFTDLNKPVTVAGENYYPIVDPAAVALASSGGPSLVTGQTPIEGCFVTTNNITTLSSAQTNPLPMPVRWMYVLKDGRITQMDSSTLKVAGASRSNPIVGRLAYWTDDETSKLNINTVSEGTFWDRPWAQGVAETGAYPNKISDSYERMLALNMPAQNEFQRYPGHPAMTSLSTVFPAEAGESTDAYNKRIYGIIPRINDKTATGVDTGSQSGTKNVNQTTAAIVPDTQRLFSSVDEFLFQVGTVSSTTPRQTNSKSPVSKFTEDDIEKARFFLTANSRSPEVNLFNKPRVTLWPLQANTANLANPTASTERNSKDKLIAFCSTIGGKPYYFQRYNTYTSPTQSPIPSSQSTSMDWTLIPRNQELYTYLQSMTNVQIPGLGGSLSAKYPNSRDQILTEMYDFIRSGVNTFSTGEAPKYYFTLFNPSGMVSGQSQIVPSVVNNTKGFGRFPTVTEAALVFYRTDKLTYRLLDASNNPTGSYIDAPDTGTVSISGKIQLYDSIPAATQNFGAVLILEPFNPSPGPPTWSSRVNYVVKGLDGLRISGATEIKPFPSSARNLLTGLDAQNNATSQTGFEQCFQYKGSSGFVSPKTLGDADPEKNYAFYAQFSLPAGVSTMTLSGGPITIEIYPGDATVFDSSTMVQSISMNFPGVAGLPLPTISYATSYNSGTQTTSLTANNIRRDYDTRISRLKSPPGNGRYGIAEDNGHEPLPFIAASGVTGDVVRSVEARYGGPGKGDYRIQAGLKNVPADFFEGHGEKDAMKGTSKAYSDTSSAARLIHSLSIDGMPGSSDTSNQNGYYAGAGGNGDTRGKLVSTATYPDTNRGNSARNRRVPVVPRGLDAAVMADNSTLGDWDTGPGSQVDGPFINPADQASSNTAQTGIPAYYTTGGYVNGAGVVESGSSFSPNRQIASAVAFGSLPSGIDINSPTNSKPWQTLLFTKQPLGGSSHPGFGTPSGAQDGPPYSRAPDHAFLDLFTMPIVEPYAISEPFSTAGKINMNYQIVPFTYLTRDTGIRAVLKSAKIMAIPTADGLVYKTTTAANHYRYSLNPGETTGTLAGFQERFLRGDIFRSASEICNISLVPQTRTDGVPAPGSPSYTTMENWWKTYLLTGDNVREQPYGNLYPRLTTKSNTYSVHVMTQSLKKGNLSIADEFDPVKDQVTGEYRGSFIIERYLDPNSDSLVGADGRTPTNELDPNGMVGPYKFRIVSSKRFAP